MRISHLKVFWSHLTLQILYFYLKIGHIPNTNLHFTSVFINLATKQAKLLALCLEFLKTV